MLATAACACLLVDGVDYSWPSQCEGWEGGGGEGGKKYEIGGEWRRFKLKCLCGKTAGLCFVPSYDVRRAIARQMPVVAGRCWLAGRAVMLFNGDRPFHATLDHPASFSITTLPFAIRSAYLL